MVSRHPVPARPATLEGLDIRKADESVSRDFHTSDPAFDHQLPNRLPGNAAHLSGFGLRNPLRGIDSAHQK